MAKNTAEFLTLRKRLTDLVGLLPPAPSPLGPLPSDIDQMSAFIVLSHAACEEFTEVRALQIATAAKDVFEGGGALGRVGKHLCIFPYLDLPRKRVDLERLSRIVGVSQFGILATSEFVTANRADLTRLVKMGYDRFKASVDNNHGADFKYQFKLLALIGLDLRSMGSTFSSRIEELARARGLAAHTSLVAATTLYDPTILSTWPADLIAGYKKMDLRLETLAKRVN